jgi:transposase
MDDMERLAREEHGLQMLAKDAEEAYFKSLTIAEQVEMLYREGYSVQEIAETINVSRNTVYTKMQKLGLPLKGQPTGKGSHARPNRNK